MVGDLAGDERARAQRRGVEAEAEHLDVLRIRDEVARLARVLSDRERRRGGGGGDGGLGGRKALGFVDGRERGGARGDRRRRRGRDGRGIAVRALIRGRRLW